MKYYGKCGNELYSSEKVCPNCGALNKAYVGDARINYTNNYRNRNISGPNANMNQENIWGYTPISMWGYFGYEILFLIPFIGLILLIIFSVGGTRNINLRTFTRSYFCLIIILVVVILLGTVIAYLNRPILYW